MTEIIPESMTDCIRGALLPPLWGVVSEYFHDVELRMMSELALMPAGKWQEYPHAGNDLIPVSDEMAEIYDVAIFKNKTKRGSVPKGFMFVYEAALHGCINVIEWDRLKVENWHFRDPARRIGAIMSDAEEMLDYMEQTSHRFITWYSDSNIIKLVLKLRKNKTLKRIADRASIYIAGFEQIAIQYNNLEALQLYFSHTVDSDPIITWMVEYFPLAVKHGSPPMLDWLYKHVGDVITDKSNSEWYKRAAHGGNLPNLIWLHQNGFTGLTAEPSVLTFAGTVEIAQWLKAHGCQWSGIETYVYAGHGLIDLLNYAVADGCPWMDKAYHAAAKMDRLEVILWAIDKGYSYDPAILMKFLENGYFRKKSPRVREWLKGQQSATAS